MISKLFNLDTIHLIVFQEYQVEGPLSRYFNEIPQAF